VPRTLRFLDDPAAFLDDAGAALAADPVLATVVAVATTRLRDEAAAGVAPDPRIPLWWVVVEEGRDVVGVGMRTAPFSPYPAYLLPMPDDAARDLARALHARGETVEAVNGALPAVRVFAEETARLAGGVAEVAVHMRLFELGTLRPPPPPPGRLRAAAARDAELVAAWLHRFAADADAQAGRPPGSSGHDVPPRDELLRRLERGGIWLWEDPAGVPVHLTASSPPSFGVSRIGPVYSPPEHRGRGYAGAAVAEVSRRLVDDGTRVCLFTDQANPTSNGLYPRLGFRPVVDMANLVVRAG
jgi:GNAT superfamily N-acetyltransferase